MRNSVPPVFVPSQIVVVDDEPDVRGAMFAALRLEGCTARSGETSTLGAEEALVDRPGVIVFEYTLPWTDAHSIVEQLRRLIRPAPSLILLSDPQTVIDACLAHGIAVFPMNPPKGSADLSVDESSRIRHTRVLTIDCPDAAERFLDTVSPVSLPPPSSLGSAPPRPTLMVVRHTRSAVRIKAMSIPPAAANDR